MLTPPQLLALFKKHGFPLWQAVAMGAIALRESGGPGAKAADPTVHNYDPDTKDDSYGLGQINWAIASVRQTLIKQMPELDGHPELLLDPDKNAEAMFYLWGEDDRNLNVAWYINGFPRHPDSYRIAFESHLPAMLQAALAAQIAT